MLRIKMSTIAPLKKTSFVGALLISSLLVSACADNKKPVGEYLPDALTYGPAIKADRADKNGKATVLNPPVGAVPRGNYVPADLKVEDAEKMANPLKSGSLPSDVVLKYEERGQTKYDISCAVCHGSKGDGKGALVEKRGGLLLKQPPSLLDSTYVKYSDGRIYYVITYGWGLMGHYTTQMPDENDRWAVVNYVRQLQKLGSKSNSGDK